jgi:hypothetical protein
MAVQVKCEGWGLLEAGWRAPSPSHASHGPLPLPEGEGLFWHFGLFCGLVVVGGLGVASFDRIKLLGRAWK